MSGSFCRHVGRDIFLFPPIPALGAVVLLPFFLPLTALSVSAAVLLYLFFWHEHRLNASLVRQTPPSPDMHLLLYGQSMRDGGMRWVESLEREEALEEKRECCIFRQSLDGSVRIRLCDLMSCNECVWTWSKQGRWT